MKRRILIPGVMLIYVFGLVISSHQAEAFSHLSAGKPTKNRLGVSSLVAAGMPISIDGATAKVADGRELSELRYIVTNRIKKAIKKIRLVAFILDASGNVKSAEGWTEEINLKSQGTFEKKGVLKNAAWNGERVVLILEQVQSSNDLWSIDIAQEIDSARTYALNGRNTLNDAQHETGQIRTLNMVPEGGEEGEQDPCSQRLSQALLACTRGLDSFSCDPNTGVFSFRCK